MTAAPQRAARCDPRRAGRGLLVAQRDHGVDGQCPSRGQRRGQYGRDRERAGHRAKRGEVEGPDAVEHALKESRGYCSTRKTDHETSRQHADAFAKHEAHDRARRCAERYA